MRLTKKSVLLAVSVLFLSCPAFASLIITGASSSEITSGSLLSNGFTSNDTVFYIQEGSYTGEVRVNATPTFNSSGAVDTNSTTINGQFRSYYVHFESLATEENYVDISFIADPSEQIVGVAYRYATLNASTSLFGIAGVTYFSGTSGNWELESPDAMTVSANSINVTLLRSYGLADDFRIITRVPEPSALLLLGSGLLGLVGYRRRKRML